MTFLKDIYKVVEKMLHSTEPYEIPISNSIISYYEIFGDKDFLKDLDGCQYRATINGKELLIIRNKFKDNKCIIYYDNIILENMKYEVIILSYDIVYNTFSQDTLYEMVNLVIRKIVNTVFDINDRDISSSRTYLNFMIDFITIKLLLFDLDSQSFLENKFSKEYINLINQSNLEQISTFFYYNDYSNIINKIKTIWENISNEPNDNK